MFERSTLLILGAGASLDYGFPLGKTLINQILKNKDKILKEYKLAILDVPELSTGNIKQNIESDFNKMNIICNYNVYNYSTKIIFDEETKKKLRLIFSRAPLRENDLQNIPGADFYANILLNSIEKHLDIYNKYILALLFFQRLREFDPLSIDFFLSVHTEFEYEKSNIGKFAILYEIYNCKPELEKRSQRQINDEGNGNWYKYLLDEILKGFFIK